MLIIENYRGATEHSFVVYLLNVIIDEKEYYMLNVYFVSPTTTTTPTPFGGTARVPDTE